MSPEPSLTPVKFRARLDVEFTLAIAAPYVASALALWVLSTDGLDERIVGSYFDASSGRWPLRGNGLAADWLHQWGRGAVFVIAVAGLIVGCFGGVNPRLRPLRRRGLFVAASIGLSAGFVALLKSISPDPAPWDATLFGGTIEHRGFFQSVARGTQRGGNSPGAHSSGAFAFMALYYCLRAASLRRAWCALVCGWLVGQAFGAVQVVRGAHFPSHNQWSCVIAWSICTLLFWFGFGGRLSAIDPHEQRDPPERR